MVAGLLFIVGLIAVLISVAIIGYAAPAMFQSVTAALDRGDANMVDVIAGLAGGLGWAVTPIVGGLVLMGFARIIMLLGSINRSLRGQA